MLKKFGIIGMLFVSSFSHAESLKQSIARMTMQIQQMVLLDVLNPSQLLQVHHDLSATLQNLQGAAAPTTHLICMKNSVGYFYPYNPSNNTVVGSSSISAGYSRLEDCQDTLPLPGESLACMKSNVGYFYPTQVSTGRVLGSDSIAAGYSSIQDCRSALPAPGARVACMKSSVGYFYPTNIVNGQIIGDTSISAGYSDLRSCQKVINQ